MDRIRDGKEKPLDFYQQDFSYRDSNLYREFDDFMNLYYVDEANDVDDQTNKNQNTHNLIKEYFFFRGMF